MIRQGFITRDNKYIFERTLYVKNHLGVVLFVHGLGGHSGRYVRFARFLNRNGYSAHLYDVRGMGKSDGERNMVDSFTEYAGDLELILSSRIKNEGKPIFVGAISLGATQVHYLEVWKGLANINKDVKGYFSIASSVFLHGNPGFLLKLVTPFVSKILPDMIVAPTLDTDLITRDPRVLERFENDPDEFHKLTIKAKFGGAYLAAYNYITRNLKHVKVPVLYLHSKNDKIVPYDFIRDEIFPSVGSDDKEFVTYKENYHDLLLDLGYDKVQIDILKWIQKRTK